VQYKATLPRDQLVRALHTRVNEIRETKLRGGCTYNGNTYDTDTQSIQNITAVVAALSSGIPLPSDFVWRTSDNISVEHTAGSIVWLAGTMLEYSNAVYSASFAIKDAITSAENPSTIPLNEGWP
jgi:hypothetical protein